ncbi:ester cyclase [Noviluteimonas gilva]|nr:ester cyclase [Lysobacter gilvus]
MPLLLSAAFLVAIASAHAAEPGNAWPATRAGQPAPKVPGMPPELARNLATADDLDFRVYSRQQWQDMHKSHAQDVVAYWPDGHSTKGLEKHLQDVQWMFTFAPDARVTEHPVRFGTNDAEWTVVTARVEGTFSKPMTLPDGSTVQPTGKAFRIPMATIGHWNKAGAMSEEYLFLDNGELMKQIGLGK